MGIYFLARRLGISAWTSVLLFLTFPTAVYQSALYTESLFLCLSVGSVLCAARVKPWAIWTGAVLGYLSGLTRPQGVLVALLWVGPLLKAWSGTVDGPGGRLQRMRRKLRLRAPAALAVLAPILGLATFSVILWTSIEAPLGFLGVQRHWAREFSPGHLLGEVLRPWRYEGPTFDYVAFWLGVGLLPALWRLLPSDLALFGTASVVLPLSTGTMLSFGRFLSMSFPHVLCLAALLSRSTPGRASDASGPRRWAQVVVLGAFVVLQCLIAKGLVGWLFVG